MEYAKLGRTGLDVSRICLGCMGFGVPQPGFHQWVLSEDESRKVICQALDLGINFFDTANVYSAGTSEEFVGRALKDLARRDQIVLATKVHGRMHEGPNGAGLSRKAILSEAPIVGATRSSHLDDAVAALSIKLSAEEVASLEEPYVPHRIIGYQ